MKQILVPTALIGLAVGAGAGLFSGVMISVFQVNARPEWIGIITGLAFGFVVTLSPLSLLGFLLVQRRRFVRARSEFTEERLLRDGPATHLLSNEGVGGWLYLTDQRLLFRSHKLNVQKHELSIPLEDIADACAMTTAKIFSNGLHLTTRSGGKEHFVVFGNRKWSEEVNRARGL